MSGIISLPGDRSWSASSWIVQGLVDDAKPHLGAFTELREEFESCEQSGLLYMDFEDQPPETVGTAIGRLVARIVRGWGETGPRGFHQPEWFPVYLGKLQELAALSAEVAGAPVSAPSLPWTAAGGRFRFEREVEGEPIHGLFDGVQVLGEEVRVLVAVTSPQTVPYPELWKALTLPIDGIAKLEYLGPVDGGLGRDCVIECEPDGAPADTLTPLGDADAASLGADVAKVLTAMHEQDLRLEMLHPRLVYAERRDGRLRLGGLAPRSLLFRRTASPVRVSMQTVNAWYGSPELVHSSGPTVPRSDVYSLCAALFHLASGVLPFLGGPLMDQVKRCVQGTIEPWEGGQALGELLLRGLALDPNARPTARELAIALDQWAG